jgi:hypothetical protein
MVRSFMGTEFMGSDAQLESFRSRAPAAARRSATRVARFVLDTLRVVRSADRSLQYEQRTTPNTMFGLRNALLLAPLTQQVKEQSLPAR